MSRRDGHDWEPLAGKKCHLTDINTTTCDQKNGKCMNKAIWQKILYACDKSIYNGGFYCQECRDKESQ